MRLAEELIVVGPVLGLVALSPVFYWRKALRQQWVSIFGIDLAKEWHKPNKAHVAHLRSQARTAVMDAFHKNGILSFPIHPLDELNHKLAVSEGTPNAPSERAVPAQSMEDVMEGSIPPSCTPWLALLVFLEMLQFMAIPFASKIPWDTDGAWKIVPNVFGCFLPDPEERRVYDLVTWVVLAPLYLAAFCICWMTFFGLCMRFLPWLSTPELQDQLGSSFVKLLKLGRAVFIRSKELLFDFGALFILTAILRSLFNSEGRLESYWPSSLLLLTFFYVALIWSDSGTNTVTWMHNAIRILFLDRHPYLSDQLPKNDHLYFHSVVESVDSQELRDLHLQVPSDQRPTFASRWNLLSASSKLIIAVLFVLAHFEELWAWILLSVSTALFLILLIESIRYGPCSFQWINVFRNIGLIAALWGNLCGFLVQGLHRHPEVTYDFTPTVVFLVGLLVILGSAPFCICLSQRLFTLSPIRLHPIKMQVLNSYYKLVALGRISAVREKLNRASTDMSSRHELSGMLQNENFDCRLQTEEKACTSKLLIHHELWVTWVKKNAHIFKMGHIELSMQDKINVCSKKTLAQCLPVTEDCDELQTIHKIKNWMSEAEMMVDPQKDVELGLRVPDDEYLSFADGAPIFTGACPHLGSWSEAEGGVGLGDCGARVFSEKSLRKINISFSSPSVSGRAVGVQFVDMDRPLTGEQSPSGSISLHRLPSSNSRPTIKSWGSTHSIQPPVGHEPSERPNRIGSMREILSNPSSGPSSAKG